LHIAFVKMSSDNSPAISYSNQASNVAPTPVNTPLNPGPIAQGLSRPTIADIPEGEDDMNGDEATDLLSRLDGPSKQAISALMQHKLASLIGRSSGYIENLPVPIKRRVEGLKGISVEYDKLLKKHKAEMYELEKKVRAAPWNSHSPETCVRPVALNHQRALETRFLVPVRGGAPAPATRGHHQRRR
jgi:nucleosome assembly protein 1-like 1